jgi:hypothetical protein
VPLPLVLLRFRVDGAGVIDRGFLVSELIAAISRFSVV